MQDLRKNKRKMSNKQMPTMSNISEQESTVQAIEGLEAIESEEAVEMDELERGCRPSNNCNTESQSNKCHDKHDKCECHDKHDKCKCHDKHDKCKCEECRVVSDTCTVNTCRDECCDGISPTFSTRDASPVAIEVDRIFDSIQFRVFTDGTAENGEPLFFDFEVIEVRGNVPSRGLARVTVDEVCMNFSTIDIETGDITVDDFVVDPVDNDSPCSTVFESTVCTTRNANCCAQNRGQNVLFRERGLRATVNDLVLEIRGHCGCTRIVALAFPAVRRNGKLCRIDEVEFRFNTLASNLCVPSSGRTTTLRQSFLANLTVDCISNAFISAEDCEDFGCDHGDCRHDCDCDHDRDRRHDCDCDHDRNRRHNCDCDFDCDCFEFTIPSGIDLILCIEETVSALVGDQIVVLANSDFEPRVVDTFANVCSFPGCGE